MSLTLPQLQRMSEIVEQALDLTDEARETLLASLPESDAPLVDRLRAAWRRSHAGGMSALATLPDLGAPAWIGRAGERVGPYELEQPLGRGGMGEVWLARRADGAFEREVALKIPRRRLGQDLAARLHFECQVAARLEHPHIARLYDAGLGADGQPWIASERIQGRPIDQAAAGRRLDERLAWMAAVARAVAYAHGRGVLHRDLKPANVLVDADGAPHLLDFGVATLTDGSATAPSGLGHTPRYAAPEQRAGGVEDVRTDVYALGVMADELCAPAGADLAAVIARARADDPERRYRGAAELADEFDRCRRGDPVRARPLNPLQRGGRWLRRHWLVGGASAAAVAALLVGGTVSLVQMQRTAQAQAREQEAQAFVADLLRIGQRQVGSADSLLDRGPDLVAARFPDRLELQWQLLGLLDRASLDMGDGALALRLRERRVALMPALSVAPPEQVQARLSLADAQLRRGLLQEAQAQLDALGPPSSDVEPDVALMRGWLQLLRGDRGGAAARLDDLDRRLPADGTRRVRWWSLRAEWQYRQGRIGDAVTSFEQGARVADLAGDPLQAADLRVRAAYWKAESGAVGEALPLFEAAQRTLRSQGGLQLVRAALDQSEFWAMAHGRPGVDGVHAMAQLSDAYRQVEWLGDAVPPRMVAVIRRNLGRALMSDGRLAEGRPHLEAGLSVMIQSEQRPLHRAFQQSELATLLIDDGRRAEAERAMLAGLADRRVAGMDLHPYVVNVYMALALNASAMGEPARALRHLDDAPDDARMAAAGQKTAWYRSVLDKTRARVLLDAGRPADALPLLDRVTPAATDYQLEVLAIGRPWLRAWALCELGRHREGQAEYDHALRTLGARWSPNSTELAASRRRAAECARRAGDEAAARRWLALPVARAG